MSFVQKLKEEAIQIALVTLYFIGCFGVLILLKKLLLAQVDVEFYGLSAVLMGALIMSKIVILLDKTALGKIYIRQALYKNVLIKSFVYTIVLSVVLFIEHLIHAYLEVDSLSSAFQTVFEHRDRNQFWIILISSFFSLTSYNVIIGIRDSMETGALTHLFFKKKENNK